MIDRVFRWMERAYAATDDALSVFRIVYAVALLLVIAPVGVNLLGLPAGAFSPPPGLPRFFPGLPGPAWVFGINALVVVLAGLVLVGFKTRAASLLLGAVLILAFAAQYSTGKISHTILVAITPVLMATSGWGARYSFDARQHAKLPDDARARRQAWNGRSLALLALATGLAFFTAGYVKINTGWLATDTSATLGHAFSNIRGSGRSPVLFEPFRLHLPALMWELMDWGVVCFELGMLFTVPWRRLFRWVLCIAVSFHLGVLLLFEIWFLTPVPTYAGFVAWALLLPRRSDLPGFYVWWDRHATKLGVALGLGLPLFAGVYWLAARQNTIMLLPEWSLIYLLFGPPVLVAGGFVVYELFRFIAPAPKADAPTLRDADAPPAQPVVLFDGHCGFCNAWVDFVMRHDPRQTFRFAPIQGDFAQRLVIGLNPDQPPDSLILIDDQGLHLYSSAALKTLARLPMPWRIFGVLRWVPAPLRDAGYRVVAKYRYKLFGRKDACRLPTPEERARFID